MKIFKSVMVAATVTSILTAATHTAEAAAKYTVIAVWVGKLKGHTKPQYRYGYSHRRNSLAFAKKDAMAVCRRATGKRCRIAAIVRSGQGCKPVRVTYRGKTKIKGKLCFTGYRQ